jgi:hypothetical protein
MFCSRVKAKADLSLSLSLSLFSTSPALSYPTEKQSIWIDMPSKVIKSRATHLCTHDGDDDHLMPSFMGNERRKN